MQRLGALKLAALRYAFGAQSGGEPPHSKGPHAVVFSLRTASEGRPYKGRTPASEGGRYTVEAKDQPKNGPEGSATTTLN